MENVSCARCGKEIIPESIIGTGYGIFQDTEEKICYACIGKLDEKRLKETGKLSGYFSKTKTGGYIFQNWPGSFSVPVLLFKIGRHNWGLRRIDFWFSIDAQKYHGFVIGENQYCTVKTTNN